MLTIYDYFLNRSFCILCHAKGRIRYKKFLSLIHISPEESLDSSGEQQMKEK